MHLTGMLYSDLKIINKEKLRKKYPKHGVLLVIYFLQSGMYRGSGQSLDFLFDSRRNLFS